MWLKICCFEENIVHQKDIITLQSQILHEAFDLVDPRIVGR